MSVDPLLLSPAPPSVGDPTATLKHIAATAEDLRGLARAEGLAMLDYLIGMVVLEASTQIARHRPRPPPAPDDT